MWPGRFLCLFAVAGAVVAAGARPPPDLVLRTRQLMASAVLHQNQGRNRLAIEELSQVVVSKGLSRTDLVRALYDRGVAYDTIGDTRAAMNDYVAALRFDPHFAPALNNRANAYRRMGRLAEAKRDYLAALACPGGAHEYSYYGLGQIAEQQDDAAAARAAYHKALAANPGFALAALSIVALDKREREEIAAAATQQSDVIVAPPPQNVAPALEQPDQTVPGPSPARPETARVNHHLVAAQSAQAVVMDQPKPAVPASDLVHLDRPATAPAKREIAPAKSPSPAAFQPDVIATTVARPVQPTSSDPVLRSAIVDAAKRSADGAQIQLGAFREQAAANQAWNRIAAASGGALRGLSPLTISVDLPGKGRFWRLRAAVTDQAEARKVCVVLVAQGQACLVARD